MLSSSRGLILGQHDNRSDDRADKDRKLYHEVLGYQRAEGVKQRAHEKEMKLLEKEMMMLDHQAKMTELALKMNEGEIQELKNKMEMKKLEHEFNMKKLEHEFKVKELESRMKDRELEHIEKMKAEQDTRQKTMLSRICSCVLYCGELIKSRTGAEQVGPRFSI